MKVVYILGSPRVNGNCATVAGKFLETAKLKGADIRTHILNELKFKGCQACMACKTTHEECVVQDGLTKVLSDVRDTDVLVLATPIYFGGVTAQTKAFIDRTFSFLHPNFYKREEHSRIVPGKKLVFITSQGQKEKTKFADIFPKYSQFMKWYGFDDTYVIRACGVDGVQDVASRPDILRMAEMISQKIFR